MALTKQEINKRHQVKQKAIKAAQRGGIAAESWRSFGDKPKSTRDYDVDMARVRIRRAIEERQERLSEPAYGC